MDKLLKVLLILILCVLLPGTALSFESEEERTEARRLISLVRDPGLKQELEQNVQVGTIDTLDGVLAAVGRYLSSAPLDGSTENELLKSAGREREPGSPGTDSARSYTVVVTVPDANFRYYLVNEPCGDFQDTSGVTDNGDGTVTVRDVRRITTISLLARKYQQYQDRGISDLTGIKSFTYLEKLFCWRNGITILDIRGLASLERLVCPYGLSYLDINDCIGLKELHVFESNLTGISVEENAALQWFHCENNPALVRLPLQYNTALKWLYCLNNPVITSLDISRNTALEKLYCEDVPALATIYVWSKTGVHPDQAWPVNRYWTEVLTRFDRPIIIDKK
ncbi:MAG: hypothetical protein QGH40_14305 [bacterium]|jgi:hypothetical protein|nr:hypothetical protein [bacterium]